jgi:hypothetical protein
MADTGRFADLPEQQLEQALADLGRLIEFPRTPDLASAIRSRLDAESTAEREFKPDNVRFLTTWRALAIAAAVALIFLGAALAGLPDFRHAVADRLGVRGIKIVFEDQTPTPVSSPVGTSLLLGQRMTLEEAQAAVPFTLKVPNLPGVGEPDEVYVRKFAVESGKERLMVAFIYYPSEALPETRETGAGALLMQLQAEDEAALLGKGIGEGGSMFRVEIDDDEGWFIAGPTSFFLYQDPSRSDCCGPDERRPSGNVLIWESNGITYRFESNLDSFDSIEFAKSLEPLP